MRLRSTLLLATLAAALPGAPLGAQGPPTAPRTYGTLHESFVRVPAASFFPVNSADGYTGVVNGPRDGPQFPNVFQAPIQLPSGARLTSIELDFVDTNTIVTVLGSLVECDALMQNCVYHPTAGGGDPDCIMAGYVCSGFAFQSGAGSQFADLTPDNVTVNNADKYYMLVAETAVNQGKIIGIRIGYVLQVSPPPGSPTFKDVPTNHPQFQFIEALAAAGLTVGCGNNNYCPSAPLTRGQMAVFLAKALGLQWP